MSSARRGALWAAVLGALCAPAAAEAEPRKDRVVPDRYIVIYENAVTDAREATSRREDRDGFRADKRYSRALKGFAAELDPRQRERLEADPAVALVAPDRPVSAAAALAPGDVAPTGTRRFGASTTSTVRGASGAGIAVLDTGIDLEHPDLTVGTGVDCMGTGSPDDANGHGTHVAGSIAARNQGSGVTGVAPGTRVQPVKVLDANGNGSYSSIICGLDWVTATRTDADPANDIAVANLSLSGPGEPVRSCSTTTDAMHRAVCRATAAGVTLVVAAGNDGRAFDDAEVPDVPAAYPQVFTVTALSDSDGAHGGVGGAPACRAGEGDDRPAAFSNFASTTAGGAHTVAAPGTCITSTWHGGGQSTMSGTSMAAPHVAGLVALCTDEQGTAGPCRGLAPSAVISKIRSDAEQHSRANTAFGFSGDPLRPLAGRYYGYLAWAGPAPASTPAEPAPSEPAAPAPSDPAAPAPAPAPTSPTLQTLRPAGFTLAAGSIYNGTSDHSRLFANDGARVEVTAAGGAGYAAEVQPYVTIDEAQRSTLSRLTVDFDASATAWGTALSLRIYNVSAQSWQTIDGPRTGVTSDRAVTFTTTTPGAYVSSTGEVRVAIRGTRSSGGWRLRTDLVSFRIEY